MARNDKKIKVLFVCLGNICRSPLGEGIFRHMVNEAGLSEYFLIDSAGTDGNYNLGERPDSKAIKAAKALGISIEDHRARQLVKDDFDSWDYVITMENSNIRDIKSMGKVKGKLHLMRDFDPEGQGEIKDPWCLGQDAFDEACTMIERSCRGLLNEIIKEFSLEAAKK